MAGTDEAGDWARSSDAGHFSIHEFLLMDLDPQEMAPQTIIYQTVVSDHYCNHSSIYTHLILNEPLFMIDVLLI